MTTRDTMDFDIVIIGAGPAGLAAAIRLKQLDADLSVCVLEKGSEVGAHLLSGAILEPRALDELIPDWATKDAPLDTPVKEDRCLFLTKKHAYRLPPPPPLKNHGNFIISLGTFAKWLAGEAEKLGVDIFPGFAAAEVLYHDDGAVKGVATGDKGAQPGIELHARQTIFAEGARGSLTKTLFKKFDLRQDCDPQTYGLGIKELWEAAPGNHKPGLALHAFGWPLDAETYGGLWMYHYGDNLVSLGLVVGLDYKNPHLSPFDEMQRAKLHPMIRKYLEGARRVGFGARCVSEGGLQSLPKLSFPGGMLIGDTAGFLNIAKIKGIHTAMKSGMLAAEAVVGGAIKKSLPCHSEGALLPKNLCNGKAAEILRFAQDDMYTDCFKKSWLYDELYAARNQRPGFRSGRFAGMINAAFDGMILKGDAPWTLHNHADHDTLKKASRAKKINYPKPDGVLTFDRASSVYLSNTRHAEGQPCHLKLRDPSIPVKFNLPEYNEPAQRYCPAGVYEIVQEESGPRFVINAENCVQCKACDIKDPAQNIDWTVPEGGNGPEYEGM